MALSKEVLEKVRSNLQDARKILEEMDADILDATRAGLDTKEIRKTADKLRDDIRKMQSVYGM